MGRNTPSAKLMSIAAVAAILTILASKCMARNILIDGEGLYAGQSLDVEPYHFIMQEDCNLVLYDHSTAVWATNTDIPGKKECRAVLQSDGNFVVYDADGRPLWASHSVRGNGNYVLVLQEDGNIVIYGSDIWSTGTYVKAARGPVVVAMNGTVDGGSLIRPVTVNKNRVPVIRKVGTLVRNILRNDEGLYAGQSLDVEPYHFIMQEDCNLVLYDHSTAVWASNTGIPGKKGCKAVLQSDGNFVVYDAEGRSLWASHSVRGNGNYVLVLQEDGNVVIYGSDIWSTGTYIKAARGPVVVAMNGTVGGGSLIGPVTVNKNDVPVIRKVGTLARNILRNDEGLYAGQSLDVEPYHFIMQEDCNLVLYDHSTAVWATNTDIAGKKGCRAVLQSDGNFVVYDAEGRSLWASHSVRGNGNYVLVLQEDGNIVIYGSDIWSTNTYRKSARGPIIRKVGTLVGAALEF